MSILRVIPPQIPKGDLNTGGEIAIFLYGRCLERDLNRSTYFMAARLSTRVPVEHASRQSWQWMT